MHGLDWSAGGFDDDTIAALASEMVASPAGILIAGDRYTFKQNGQSAKGRTVTAAYRRLVDQTCFVGGCSGTLCSDHEGAVSTCEYKEEYACYQSATCERQADGQCGWTQTEELKKCLAGAEDPGPIDAGPGPIIYPPSECVVTGCSGQLCSDTPVDSFTTCEWRGEYACYTEATCARQADGKCGWTQTDELEACLKKNG